MRRPVRRFVRWLIRIGVALVVLAVIGLVAFTWFAYWPFEGKVARLETLVPGEVDFVWRGSWSEIRDGGAVTRWLFDDPPLPGLAAKNLKVGEGTLAQALEKVPELEAQVNDGIPSALKPFQGFLFGSRDFRVERDLLGGDLVGAGRWCGGGSPRDRPPQWRELLVLTRVTPQVKFAFEAARHDFVRKKLALGPGVRLEARSDGLLELEDLTVVPPRKPETCEGGVPMPPLKTWYVGRVKDVLAVSNSEDLIGRFVERGKGQGESVLDWKDDFRPPEAPGGVSGSADLTGLRSYLNRGLSTGDPTDKVASFLQRFVAVDALDRLTGRVVPLSTGDGVVATAQVRYNPDRLRAFQDVSATYDLAPERIATSIARLVPEKDTAAVAVVRTPPRVLLQGIWQSLDPVEQQTVEDNVRRLSAERRRRKEPAYENVAAFLDEFAGQLGSTTGLAVARIPSVFDAAQYLEYYSSGEPVPLAALAVMVRIREGASQEQVNQWLSDRVAALGFDPPEPVTSPDGLAYSRLHLRPKVDSEGTSALPPEYANVKPAFKVAEGHVLLSTREDYLLEILKTMRGGASDPRAVGATRDFDLAMRDLPPDATFGLYLHGGNLRALLWDYRNDRVRRAHPDNEYARDYRVRLLRQAGSRPDQASITQQVDDEMVRWRKEEYPRFVEEYRRSLDEWRRVAGAGFVLSADRNASRVNVGASVVFSGPGAP